MVLNRQVRHRGFIWFCTPDGLSRCEVPPYVNVLLRLLGFAAAFITLALVPGAAKGQEYQLRHYGVADGLAHGAVLSIYQDRKGYMWFSTREGLSRFDGYNFVNYGERDGLEQQLINDVTEDKQGRIWVATNGAGVALFLGDGQVKLAKKFKSFLVVNGGDSKGKNNVNRLLADSRNNLWALTDNGLFRASLSDVELQFEAIKTESMSYESNAALEDRRGRLWFGYGYELVEVNEGRLINHGAVEQERPSPIMSIVEDSAGKILVANQYGLYEFVSPASQGQRGQWRKLELNLKPKQNIRRVLVDSAGDLYVGTNVGLVKRRKDGRQAEIYERRGRTVRDRHADP